MNDSEKIIADARRIVKHERAENGDRYDGYKACEKIADLFAKSNPNMLSLARSVGDYWFSTYINASANPALEPTDKNLDRLSALQNFIEGLDDDRGILSDEDWQELGQIVRFEAEDMPIDILSSMMSLIVDHGAL